jgi:hypothetical protein
MRTRSSNSWCAASSIALFLISFPASDVFAASGDDSLTRTNIFAPLSTAPAQVRSTTAAAIYCGGLLAARGDFWIDLSCRIYAKLSALGLVPTGLIGRHSKNMAEAKDHE